MFSIIFLACATRAHLVVLSLQRPPAGAARAGLHPVVELGQDLLPQLLEALALK